MTDRTEGPSAGVRIRVMKRDRFRCTYCGRPGTDVELEVDHIVPASKGGSNHMSNLTTACRSCNQGKGNESIEPPQAQADKARPNDLLSGMFLHTFIDGEMHFQGRVLRTDGVTALVQLYSWMHGGPTNVVAMAVSDILNADTCTLYATAEHWNSAAEDYGEREQERERPGKSRLRVVS